jgi:hypothetical protein
MGPKISSVPAEPTTKNNQQRASGKQKILLAAFLPFCGESIPRRKKEERERAKNLPIVAPKRDGQHLRMPCPGKVGDFSKQEARRNGERDRDGEQY